MPVARLRSLVVLGDDEEVRKNEAATVYCPDGGLNDVEEYNFKIDAI